MSKQVLIEQIGSIMSAMNDFEMSMRELYPEDDMPERIDDFWWDVVRMNDECARMIDWLRNQKQ